MPSKQDGAPSDSRKPQEGAGSTRSGAGSDRHDTKERGAGRKDSNHATETKTKNGDEQAAEGAKTQGGLFGSVLNAVKSGFAGSAHSARAENKPSSKEPGVSGELGPSGKTPRNPDVPTDKKSQSKSRSHRPRGAARHTPSTEDRPASKGTREEGLERQGEKAKEAETGNGEPSSQSKKAKRTSSGRGEKRTSTRSPREAETTDGVSDTTRRRQRQHIGTEPDVPAKTKSQASEKTVTDNTAGAKPEQARKHAKDRFHDITNMLRSDTVRSNQSNASQTDTASQNDGVQDTKSNASKPKVEKTRKGTHHAAQANGSTKRTASVRTELQGTWDDQHSCTNTNSASRRTSIRSAISASRSSPEVAETACANCGDWIAFNPRTLQLLDLSLLPAEVCLTCWQPWPRNKPLTPEMIEVVQERLKISQEELRRKGINLYCERCAAEMRRDSEGNRVDQGAQVEEKAAPPYADEGVQVDERDLQANDPDWRGDHYCKKLDFERDRDNLESQRFEAVSTRAGGTKRALLIGINYSAQPHELRGCRNDVVNVYRYLRSNGYRDENIEILLDIKPYRPPTKANITKYMDLLVQDAKPGDNLFLHYSGHGGQTKEREDGKEDEIDGKDECIYPVDYKRISNGMLVDDDMHKILIQLSKGAQLTALFDSCHSGSVLDLPWVLTNEGTMKRVEFRKPRTPEVLEKLNNCGTIILWSGCKDTQTSKDTRVHATPVGAMSYAFIQANQELLEKRIGKTSMRGKSSISKTNIEYTYDELLARVRELLGERNQVPQLSSTENLKPYGRKVYV